MRAAGREGGGEKRGEGTVGRKDGRGGRDRASCWMRGAGEETGWESKWASMRWKGERGPSGEGEGGEGEGKGGGGGEGRRARQSRRTTCT